jgi:hypothetical protein
MRVIYCRVFGPIKGTAIVVGLAVMLSGVFGAASIGLAADGEPFLLGKQNVARAVSTLVKRGPGPALSLKVGSGQAPLAVNSPEKVTNLNADSLDGKDASEFAAARAEEWHEVGTPGEPGFIDGFGCGGRGCAGWANFGNGHNTVGFYKDPYGVVHLKGVVKWTNAGQNAPGGCGWAIFQLPEGYRPAATEAHASMRNDTPSRVDVWSADAGYGPGTARVCDARNTANGDYYLLDGISFRATDC